MIRLCDQCQKREGKPQGIIWDEHTILLERPNDCDECYTELCEFLEEHRNDRAYPKDIPTNGKERR